MILVSELFPKPIDFRAALWYRCWGKEVCEDILRELFYGQLDLRSKGHNDSEETLGLLRQTGRSKDRLLCGLTEAQRADFMQYESGNAQLSLISELEAFKQGFRLGARLIIDVLSVDCDEALSK